MKEKDGFDELRIRGIHGKFKSELKAIAANVYGISLSAMVRMKLKELRDATPEHKRTYAD